MTDKEKIERIRSLLDITATSTRIVRLAGKEKAAAYKTSDSISASTACMEITSAYADGIDFFAKKIKEIVEDKE